MPQAGIFVQCDAQYAFAEIDWRIDYFDIKCPFLAPFSHGEGTRRADARLELTPTVGDSF